MVVLKFIKQIRKVKNVIAINKVEIGITQGSIQGLFLVYINNICIIYKSSCHIMSILRFEKSVFFQYFSVFVDHSYLWPIQISHVNIRLNPKCIHFLYLYQFYQKQTFLFYINISLYKKLQYSIAHSKEHSTDGNPSTDWTYHQRAT